MFRNFLYDEDCVTNVEYALILSVILVVIIMAVVTLAQQSMATFTTTGNAIGSGS